MTDKMELRKTIARELGYSIRLRHNWAEFINPQGERIYAVGNVGDTLTAQAEEFIWTRAGVSIKNRRWWDDGADTALELPLPRGCSWDIEYHPGGYCWVRISGNIRLIGPDGDMGSEHSAEAESGSGDLAATICEAWLVYRRVDR